MELWFESYDILKFEKTNKKNALKNVLRWHNSQAICVSREHICQYPYFQFKNEL